MRPASKDEHNEMDDTKGVRTGKSRGDVDISNHTRSFLSIA